MYLAGNPTVLCFRIPKFWAQQDNLTMDKRLFIHFYFKRKPIIMHYYHSVRNQLHLSTALLSHLQIFGYWQDSNWVKPEP